MTLPRQLKRHAKYIAEVIDERGSDEGIWVHLRSGWCSEPGTHVIHEDTFAECAAQMPPTVCHCCAECRAAHSSETERHVTR